MEINLSYTLKVWLSGIAIGTLAFWAIMTIGSPSDNSHWQDLPTFLLLSLFMAALLSFPAAFVFYIAIYTLKTRNLTSKKCKVILSLLAVTMSFATFLIFDPDSLLSPGYLILIVSYTTPTIPCIWYFKLQDIVEE
ncbi:hypothetical protein ACJVDH_07490 [Pedobacter sp. AW1-32]|uniref:hypothetical protein n=1 Tax=Pedobacter sp. AW1-32 TaxID=3383026 RepID=UPI003FEF2BF6